MNLKNQKKQRLKTPRFKQKTLSLVVAAMIYSTPLYAKNVILDLLSQSLQQSIQQLAQQSGIEIVTATEKIQSKTAPRIKGDMSVDQALETLLQGSGLTVKKQADVYVIVEKASVNAVSVSLTQPSIATGVPDEKVYVEMETITVYGDKDRDTKGYDDVYDKNYSTVYAGKDQIERFKGTTPSDLFKGMSNVYSGDARNSGALDPNIRGMQGQGRVPVTIDGTEQEITVWRGYNGVNSRSYIDPNLISSIKVVKGASLNSDIKTGIAGGVAAKTLEVDDIVRAGEKYGADIKVEGANNTLKEQKTNSYAGQDYRDVAENLGIENWRNSGPYNSPLTNVTPHTDKDNKWYKLDDQAYRIAVATKQEDFDLLAAYAYRSRGNYFSGKSGKDFYDNPVTNLTTVADLVSNMANIYKPGGEVTNTSSESESYLLKGEWRPTDDQTLSASYRKTNLIYGEIMPSRIWFYETGLPQWPLSEIDTKAYNLEYRFNPDNNKWVNFTANLWQTDTDSNTYTSGGFPNYIDQPDTIFNSGTCFNTDGTRCRLSSITGLIYDTGNSVAKNTRKGVSLSNKFALLDNLNLTLAADLSKEKLTTEDIDQGLYNGIGWRMLPRAGRRSEHEYKFNFDWQPTTWLSLSAGMRSTSYWSFDDYLNNSKGIQKVTTSAYQPISVTEENQVEYTQADYDVDYAELTAKIDRTTSSTFKALYTRQRDALAAKLGTMETVTTTNTYKWYATNDGKYLAENNPILNGEVNANNENITNIFYGDDQIESINEPVKKKKDHKNWAPALSAAIQLNKNNRIYANYSEAYRMPSLFETTLGFSASQSGYDIKPEHAHNFEIGYVYNLKDLFKLSDGYADIKFSYFNNRVKDVIERNYLLVMSNIDEQKIAGYELQGRYDNTRFFGNFSVVYNSKNQVCDETSALINYLKKNRTLNDNIDKCIKYGFPGGYLFNMALPKWQANIDLGARFFDQKLELGTRATYFKGLNNPYANDTATNWLNAPLEWDSTLTFDAYTRYQYSENLALDLIGSNLTNRYYLDAISRSAMPAPGRTIKFGLNYKF